VKRDLLSELSAIFDGIEKYTEIDEESSKFDSGDGTGLEFSKLPWRKLKKENWECYPEVIFRFQPHEFHRLTPSVVSIALDIATEWFWPFDSFMSIFDSPSTSYWDQYRIDRFSLFSTEELDFLYRVLEFFSGLETYDLDRVSNSMITILLIEENLKL